MNTQDTKELSPIEAFVGDVITYSSNAVRIAALKEEQAGLVSANSELRKAIVPFFKQHANDKWSTLSKPIKAAIVAANVSDVDGLLGVLKTSFEYKVLPTQQNADRFRKLETWVGWNGVVVPNTYGKVHTKEGAGKKASAPTAPALNPVLSAADAEKIVDKQLEAIDKAETKKAAAALDKMENVLDTATMTPSKSTTPQKDTAKGDIPRANVNSSDTPIHPIEHCSLLLDQLTKNEAFREVYVPILAIMLDVEKSTLTRCMVQARDELNRGNK